MKSLLIAAAAILPLSIAPAFAASTTDQVELCASALDAQGLAALDAYRAKFVKAKGGAVQTIVLKLVPVSDGPSLTGECQIKRGEVVGAAIKA